MPGLLIIKNMIQICVCIFKENVIGDCGGYGFISNLISEETTKKFRRIRSLQDEGQNAEKQLKT